VSSQLALPPASWPIRAYSGVPFAILSSTIQVNSAAVDEDKDLEKVLLAASYTVAPTPGSFTPTREFRPLWETQPYDCLRASFLFNSTGLVNIHVCDFLLLADGSILRQSFRRAAQVLPLGICIGHIGDALIDPSARD
jgi:hypothetical protein